MSLTPFVDTRTVFLDRRGVFLQSRQALDGAALNGLGSSKDKPRSESNNGLDLCNEEVLYLRYYKNIQKTS